MLELLAQVLEVHAPWNHHLVIRCAAICNR